MEFDLHTHSCQGSACSRMPLADLVMAAKERGLAGVCVTDHDFLWDPGELADLTANSGIQVYGGVELSTTLGEVLVYGVHFSLLDLRDNPLKLKQVVQDCGGFMVAAHPFRSDYADNLLTRRERGVETLDPRVMSKRPLFQIVDTLEVYNGRGSVAESQVCLQVAEELAMKGTGGSDAHSVLGVGSCTTVFKHPVNNEADLVGQLLRGSFFAKKRKRS